MELINDKEEEKRKRKNVVKREREGGIPQTRKVRGLPKGGGGGTGVSASWGGGGGWGGDIRSSVVREKGTQKTGIQRARPGRGAGCRIFTIAKCWNVGIKRGDLLGSLHRPSAGWV